MTSEFKTRDIWEVANQLEGYVGPDTEERLAAFLMREGKEAAKLAERIVELEEELNTRSVPDVPELVRYSAVKRYGREEVIEKNGHGEYVLYSQAAEIIRSMIPRVNNCGRYIAERNDGTLMYLNHGNTWQGCDNFIAAKDKDIAGWKDVAGSYANKFATTKLELNAAEAELAQIKAQEPYGYIDGPHFSTEPIEGWIPIYAAPTDAEFKAVELKAEIERLREALREVHTMIEHDRTGSFKMVQNVINAALSEKEPS